MIKAFSKLNRSKTLLLVFIILSILALLRYSWVHLFNEVNSEQPEIQQGVLDLRAWDGIEQEIINLDGDWRFFPNELITNQDSLADLNASFMDVPGEWNQPYAYGTYQLRILVDPASTHLFSISIPSIRNASNLYVNNQLLASTGKVTANSINYLAKNLPVTRTFTANDAGEINIIIQAANHLTPEDGGIVRSIKFGEENLIQRNNQFSYSLQLIVMVAFIIHAMYSIGLFLANGRNWRFIHVSLLLFGATITHSLSSNEKILATWLNLDFEWSMRLANIASTIIIYSLWMIIKEFLSFNVKAFHYLIISFSFLSFLFACLLPIKHLDAGQGIFSLLLILALIAAIIILFWKQDIFQKDTIWVLIALVTLLNSYIWWGIWNNAGIEVMFYPIDLLITISCFTVMWLTRYFDIYNRSIEQAKRLEQMAKEKDEFLAKTSHELRNPLHGMLNLTQTTLERNQAILDHRSKKELEIVHTIGGRLSLILDDLLYMASLKMTKLRINRKTFYLQSIVSGIIDMFEMMIDASKIKMNNEIADDLPPVYGDENRIIQVLYNLIDNAMKYTKQGMISIYAREVNNKILISVEDTGYGMDQETVKRVLEPYERGESTINHVQGGIGLGLSISKQLIELHEEELFITSIQNKGTSITFSLPISNQPNDQEDIPYGAVINEIDDEQMAQEYDRQERPNILIVDDDVINLHVIESVLSTHHYNIDTLQQSEAVINQLQQKQWDLVILDVMMPNLSGYDITKQIRQRFNQTELPVLLLTARDSPADIEVGFQVGANDYITKPVDARELRARVSNLVHIKLFTRKQLEMETKWLQAQIQPHFIFNTLNAINALSTIDIDKMRTLVEEFSSFLRNKIDFSAYEKWVSIDEEISIVKSFLYIEQVRYGGKLNINWHLSYSNRFYIPMLLLQPIVENAVQHGIRRQSYGGTVDIKVVEKQDYWRMIIRDNGAGMDRKRLQLVQDWNSTEGKGIGVMNTNERLRKYFGTGLQIKSKVGVGTVVAFNVYRRQNKRM